MRTRATEILEQARGLHIDSHESFLRASELLRYCRVMKRRIHDFFEETIISLHRLHKAEIAKRNSLAGPFDSAASTIEKKMLEWRAQAELSRQQRSRTAGSSVRGIGGTTDESLEDLIVLPDRLPAVRGQHVREIWKWEVEDIGKVPKRFLKIQVDSQAVREYLRSHGNEPPIPGLKVWKEALISVTGA